MWYLVDTGGHTGILCYMGFKEVLRSFIAPSSMYTVCLTPVFMGFQEGLGCLCIFHAYSSSGLAGRGSQVRVLFEQTPHRVSVVSQFEYGDVGEAFSCPKEEESSEV